MNIELKPGEKVTVSLEGTDGTFAIDFDSKGDHVLTVEADLPDSYGHVGVIYKECFSEEYMKRAEEKAGVKPAGE